MWPGDILLLGCGAWSAGCSTRLGAHLDAAAAHVHRCGLVIGMVNVLLPYTILDAAERYVGNPGAIRATAAQSLMASPFTAFRRGFLPLTMPGVGPSFLLVFVLPLGFFITPAMLGSPHEVMIANLISSVTASLRPGLPRRRPGHRPARPERARHHGHARLVWRGRAARGHGSRRPAGASLPSGGKGPGHPGTIDLVFTPVWPRLFTVVGGGVLAFWRLSRDPDDSPSPPARPRSSRVPAALDSRSSGQCVKYFTARGWLDSTWHSVVIAAMTAGPPLLLAVPGRRGRVALSPGGSAGSCTWRCCRPSSAPSSTIVAVGDPSRRPASACTHTGSSGVVLGHTVIALPIAISSRWPPRCGTSIATSSEPRSASAR